MLTRPSRAKGISTMWCLQRLLLLWTLSSSIRAFQPLLQQPYRSQRTFLSAEDTTTDSSVNGGGGLVLNSDVKSQLFNAFTALDIGDQYDAVLTGLCAKILDDNTGSVEDPLQLLEEMNQKRIRASPRSIMALMDSAAKTSSAELMARTLSAMTKNGGIAQYGAQQADVRLLPTSPTTKVKCADGSTKTRAERLASVAEVPSDDRAKEVTSALAVGAVVAGCLVTDVMHMNDLTPLTNLVLTSLLVVGVIDNAYDLLQGVTRMAVAQVNQEKSDFSLPDKATLPLGLGTGQVTGNVVRGFSRLLTVDAERESQCEAAALYAAYQLGLPCFAFRPNALESSVLVIESTQSAVLPKLDSASGILRLLIWLLAPVAAESAKHSQLIMSDPKEAIGFLERLEEYMERNPSAALESIWWLDNDQERRDLLQWAYAEADALLRENRAPVTAIAQSLTGGAATIGDCVAVMEQW